MNFDLVAVCREFGFPILICAVLLVAIVWVAKQLIGAFKNRIETLEKIVASQGRQISELVEDRQKRSDAYGSGLKALVVESHEQSKETNRVSRETLSVMRQLIDCFRKLPCRVEEAIWDAAERRGHRAPTPSDLPDGPPTDRVMRHG